MSPLPARGISFAIPGGDGGTSHPPHLQGEREGMPGDKGVGLHQGIWGKNGSRGAKWDWMEMGTHWGESHRWGVL